MCDEDDDHHTPKKAMSWRIYNYTTSHFNDGIEFPVGLVIEYKDGSIDVIPCNVDKWLPKLSPPQTMLLKAHQRDLKNARSTRALSYTGPHLYEDRALSIPENWAYRGVDEVAIIMNFFLEC